MANSVYSFIILAEVCMSVYGEWGVEGLRKRQEDVLWFYLKQMNANSKLGNWPSEVFPYLVSTAHRVNVNFNYIPGEWKAFPQGDSLKDQIY